MKNIILGFGLFLSSFMVSASELEFKIELKDELNKICMENVSGRMYGEKIEKNFCSCLSGEFVMGLDIKELSDIEKNGVGKYKPRMNELEISCGKKAIAESDVNLLEGFGGKDLPERATMFSTTSKVFLPNSMKSNPVVAATREMYLVKTELSNKKGDEAVCGWASLPLNMSVVSKLDIVKNIENDLLLDFISSTAKPVTNKKEFVSGSGKEGYVFDFVKTDTLGTLSRKTWGYIGMYYEARNSSELIGLCLVNDEDVFKRNKQDLKELVFAAGSSVRFVENK